MLFIAKQVPYQGCSMGFYVCYTVSWSRVSGKRLAKRMAKRMGHSDRMTLRLTNRLAKLSAIPARTRFNLWRDSLTVLERSAECRQRRNAAAQRPSRCKVCSERRERSVGRRGLCQFCLPCRTRCCGGRGLALNVPTTTTLSLGRGGYALLEKNVPTMTHTYSVIGYVHT
jgi:hypothetical protein